MLLCFERHGLRDVPDEKGPQLTSRELRPLSRNLSAEIAFEECTPFEPALQIVFMLKSGTPDAANANVPTVAIVQRSATSHITRLLPVKAASGMICAA